ncbi:hypothetical protein [Paenibacillus stellifer]|nr:hypothetical protein [Paenibacillus stellifer]
MLQSLTITNATMEKSTQRLTHREDTPKIESVAGHNGLPKFAPEQFLER